MDIEKRFKQAEKVIQKTIECLCKDVVSYTIITTFKNGTAVLGGGKCKVTHLEEARKPSKHESKREVIIHLNNSIDYNFFCRKSVKIGGGGKCKEQCNQCIVSSNTPLTDTKGHIGSEC